MWGVYNLKKFLVTVNGEKYEVEVEEIGGEPGFLPPHTPAPALVAAAPPVMVPGGRIKPVLLLDDAGSVNSPMPGVINQVNVQVGDQVKAGDVLFILEAMKMENPIKADIDGIVKEVRVAKGQAVNSGDPLAIIA